MPKLQQWEKKDAAEAFCCCMCHIDSSCDNYQFLCFHHTSYEIKQSWNAEQSSNNEYYDVLHKPNAIPLPKIVDDNIADVEEPWTEGDVTYFFHIPRTAGASVKDVSAYINVPICLDRLDIINNSQ